MIITQEQSDNICRLFGAGKGDRAVVIATNGQVEVYGTTDGSQHDGNWRVAGQLEDIMAMAENPEKEGERREKSFTIQSVIVSKCYTVTVAAESEDEALQKVSGMQTTEIEAAGNFVDAELLIPEDAEVWEEEI